MTNERGKTTSYTYGDTSKLLTQAKDPKGNTTDYTYDNADRVKKVASGVASNEYEYAQDRLSAIWHNNRQVKYGFGYDGIGNQTSVTVGNGSASKTLTSNSYDSRNRLTSALYGNGQRVNYKYDSLDRPVIKYYNNDNPNNAGYHTVYNANGLVGLHKDVVNTQRTRYTYDLAQRLVRVRRNVGVLGDNGAFLAELSYTYENNTNRLSAYTLELLLGSGTSKVKTSFTYGNKNGSQMTDAVYEVRQNGGLHKTYTYDGLGRKTQTMMSMGGANKPIRYTYVGVKDNRTTTMLESLDNFGEKLSYTYDDNGNIETIRKNGVLQETYHYDGLNQLVRADSAAQNKSFVYTYDAGGNILSVKEYAYTTGALGTAVKTVNYGYTDGTWKDLLTSYAGQTITYDGIGNPLTYRDGLSMTWRNGRELASLTKNGVTASYLYDESGLRTKKTVGGVVTNYHVINGVLYGEYTGSHRLLYMFDEAGTRYSFLYNGSTYYYVFNGQGDVIGITDGYGNMLARYTYDAWGKPLTITDGAGNDVSGNAGHIANVNPFRYRGYYYDAESGLYYLQSRYYDPVVGRFINADGVLGGNGDMLSFNLFGYCSNNPVNCTDPTGMFADAVSQAPSAQDAGIVWDIGSAILQWLASGTATTAASTAGIVALVIAMPVFLTGSVAHNPPRGATTQTKSKSKPVVKAAAVAITATKPKNKFNVHHIVPQTASKAGYARARLQTVYDINDPINLITISEQYHQHMHTNTYYDFVNGVFAAKTQHWNSSTSFTQRRSDVNGALNFIRQKITLNYLSGSYTW